MSGYIGNIPVPQATQTRDNFTATDGQTTFSTSGYTPSYLDVYLNGIHLDPSDYTATNGTDVVLASGATAGDVVTVVAYTTFEVGAYGGDLDVNGTVTADGLNVSNETDSTLILASTKTLAQPDDVIGQIQFYGGDTTAPGAGTKSSITAFVQNSGSVGDASNLVFSTSDGITNNVEAMRIDSDGNVGIGTDSPDSLLSVALPSATGTYFEGGGTGSSSELRRLLITASTTTSVGDTHTLNAESANGNIAFATTSTERMRIDSSGNLLVGQTTASDTTAGIYLADNGRTSITRNNSFVVRINRLTSDGELVRFYQNNSLEGGISVSGSTVSYNGGHLARWSQLSDGTKNESIVKGTVLTNLDQMAVWHHEAVEAQDAVYDEEGNVVTEAVEAKEAYTEDNEQLNCMAVSSVEGDPNVAGVFVNWDDDDDEFNDMNIAMTGDMVIRIAQGTTVARGDLLMSAGDGTAKPQGDDIVRSKTIAKVTSTNVSHTYDDGSYLVPCVLMAC